ncbi:MAG: tRNA lysidine(34) synthetase TilS [Dongiaceae bacterium]
MPEIDIAQLMAPLGPFERSPAIAVAVSGGSDSLGLGLQLAEWVTGQNGHLHVLTVDHGLRPEAAAECAHVVETFAAIPRCSADVLRWQGEKPAHGLQAAARNARYALMTAWCRARGILHLAVAHTAEDQAETVAMRSAHGSGASGLAGMAAARPEQGVRLIRPLLAVSRQAIRAWLKERGQSWVDDPSNELSKFERVRIRRSLDAEQSLRALDRAREMGVARNTRERAAALVLAEAGQVHEAGYVSVSLDALLRLAPDRALQAAILRQIILNVSGQDYAPGHEVLLASLQGGRTLGGCQVRVQHGRLYVFRELAAISPPISVSPGWSGAWDNRFHVGVLSDLPPAAGWAVGALGEAGLRQAMDRFGLRLKRHPIPLPARLALPALWRGEHVVAQPHLGLGQGLAASLAPRHTVTTCGFTVAAGRPHTIYSSVPC